MLWFKRKQRNEPLSDAIETQELFTEDTSPISKEKFIMEGSPSDNSIGLPLYEIYKRFQEDWESRGYKDAINFPETTYRDNQKKIIIDKLRLLIKEVLLRYDDKLVDLDIHINQAQKNGLMETHDKYVQEKKKLVSHREELAALDKDAEEVGEKTKPIIISYEMGFTRGLVSLSNEKVSEIMTK